MTIQILIKVLFLSSIFLITTQNMAHAQVTDSSAIKLMEVTHIDKLVQRAMLENTLVIPQITQQMISKNNTELSQEQKNKIDDIVNDYMQKMLLDINKKQNKQQLRNDYVKVAKNNFTQAEIDAQLAFYDSEIGQSIMKKEPKMVNDFIKTVMPSILENSKSSFNALLPQFQADIKTALGK